MSKITTQNLKLTLTPDEISENFHNWRMEINGDKDSNMVKIDKAYGSMKNDIAVLQAAQSKVYGVRFAGSKPAGTRLRDAEGLTAAIGVDDQIVENDFDKIYPWSHMRRCNGSYDSNGDFIVSAYEGEPEYAVDGTNGNVWVEIPQFWVKEVIDDSDESEEKYITPYEMEGFRLPQKFYKLNLDKRTKAYIAAYESGKVDGVPVSYSGLDVSSPAWSHNNYITACKKIGEGYCPYTSEDFELISFLFQIEFATRNSQSIMSGATGHTTTAVTVAQVTENENYVLIKNNIKYFANGYPVKLHTSGNSAAGDPHIVSQVVPYYLPAEVEYDPEKQYYTRSGDEEPYSYEPYTYDEGTWEEKYPSLYYATDMNKVVLEEDAHVTTTETTKIYVCPFKSGYTDNVIASSGAYRANDGKWPIKYRGIENPWGNVWKVMSGVLISDHEVYVSKDSANDPTDNSAASITSRMTKLNYILPSSNSYAKKMGYDPEYPTYRFTSEVGGSSTTYYCDNFYQSTGVRCVLSGGSVSNGANAGLFYFYCSHTPSNSYWYISSRLSYTG